MQPAKPAGGDHRHPMRGFHNACGLFDVDPLPRAVAADIGEDDRGDAGIVESYISYLRRKIDPHSSEPLIQTKRGFGYMLKAGKSA
mgnify:CR=1 FL=1